LTTMMPTETSTLSSPSFGGTTRWMSPELLDPDEHDGYSGRTKHSDNYAFGMVVYEVLTGNVPFHLLHEYSVINKVLRGDRPEIPADTSAAAHKSGVWAIVQQSWAAKPFERPTLSLVRQRLFAAVEMWDTDLEKSTASDGFVDVPPDVLLSSGDSSDAESVGENEGGASSHSFLACSVHPPPKRATTPGSLNHVGFQNPSPRRSAVALPQDSRRMPTPSFGEFSRPRASGTPRGIRYQSVEADAQSHDSDDPFLPEPMIINPDRRHSGSPLSFCAFGLWTDVPVDRVRNSEGRQSLKLFVEPESEDDSGPPDFVYEAKSPPLKHKLA